MSAGSTHSKFRRFRKRSSSAPISSTGTDAYSEASRPPFRFHSTSVPTVSTAPFGTPDCVAVLGAVKASLRRGEPLCERLSAALTAPARRRGSEVPREAENDSGRIRPKVVESVGTVVGSVGIRRLGSGTLASRGESTEVGWGAGPAPPQKLDSEAKKSAPSPEGAAAKMAGLEPPSPFQGLGLLRLLPRADALGYDVLPFQG